MTTQFITAGQPVSFLEPGSTAPTNATIVAVKHNEDYTSAPDNPMYDVLAVAHNDPGDDFYVVAVLSLRVIQHGGRSHFAQWLSGIRDALDYFESL